MATRSIVPRADGEGSIGTLAKKWGIIHAKNILTSDAAAHNSLYRGAEITYSWATIKANIQAGNFENYYIGDYKTITLTTGETVIMEIAGINCYKGWGPNGYVTGNHIDFISRDCLATPYQMNSAATNNGKPSPASPSPWASSDLYETLNDSSTGVLSTINSDLRSLITGKVIYAEQRRAAGTVSSDTGAAWIGGGDLWIPAETEVFDHATWSEIGYGTTGFMQYPIFRLNPSKIVKGAGNGGSGCTWWLMSADKSHSTTFCATSGGVADIQFANSNYRVPLCFRVA